MMEKMTPAAFDELFHALADPYRRGMIERLARGPASVTELAEPVALGLPAVLKHLRVLEEGGIVVSTKAGRVRTYRMQTGAFDAINSWIAERESAMHAAFDRLAAAMAELPEEEA